MYTVIGIIENAFKVIKPGDSFAKASKFRDAQPDGVQAKVIQSHRVEDALEANNSALSRSTV